ncbi:disintegrin and metalloproteinase domain-containing protein 10 [Condylostylus longicornis]|uniref:disintegrin and metalloproteinase domain-containing protein 10 n=1 Tax=Condylostylus longicornis TaxID=2530218 RepID=UPI00244DB153|nr:disintegrin and metalloproteinase domain-containing protein 10 [Condylostylus longicornis]
MQHGDDDDSNDDNKNVLKGLNRLNEYISHYETLSYDHEHIHTSHMRAKRSVTKDHYINLKLNAHGRNFHLRIKRDLETFSDKLEVHSTNGPINVDTSHIYEGHVIGEKNSRVFGSIINGVFEGKVITNKDSYYIENAKHYFPNHTYKTEGFHSVIYNEKHVEDPYKDVREGHHAGCGITDEVSQWMENIQNSAVWDDETALPEELPTPISGIDQPKQNEHHKLKINDHQMPDIILKPEKRSGNINNNNNNNNNYPSEKYNVNFELPYQIYSKEANYRNEKFNENNLKANSDNIEKRKDNHNKKESKNYLNSSYYETITEDWHKKAHERVRRATTTNSRSREDNKNTCSLYIQTDPLIWRHIREGIADHDRGRKSEIDEKTREEILSLIAHHVTAVNYIYRNTKFDGRTEHRNIRFEVQRIKIDDDSACRPSYNGPHNSFCNEHMDVSNFLNLHSLEDHGDFCLAYVFTYRDFTGGTLGLAWVASASGASGGICEKYKTYTETVGGQYQSTKRSLNTGIITFVNYNSRVPPKVSQLTLAHEIGHNFGSPHDYPQECRPGGLAGNFIMFASATSGDRPNNSKFSPCSIRNISNVLDVLVGNQKRDCFKASEGAFCGNKIVESGEECDCGFNEDECKDKCCYPRLISEYDLSLNASAKGCARRAKTQCSPSQGPCCLSDSCTFVPQHYHQKCKEETECSWSSTCNGSTPECPEPKPRDDKTKCNNGTALCIRGECSGSICLLWNMTECFLTSQIVPHIDKRQLCQLACQNGNDTNTCRSTSEFAHLYDLPVGGISLRPGSPCDNFQGYCDVFLKCRAVDAEGPLVRLKNLLFNKETLLTVAQWITENWYAVVLMGILFIIVMGIFVKCCAVHTPSSNPKKRPARRISETLRRPMNTLRRMRHPHHGQHGRNVGPRSVPPPGHDHRSRADWDRRAHPGGPPHNSRNGRSDGGRHHHSGRPTSGTRGGQGSSGASASHHGYAGGDGRGPQYYPPKAVTGQPVNYNNRPLSTHSNAPPPSELYADGFPPRNGPSGIVHMAAAPPYHEISSAPPLPSSVSQQQQMQPTMQPTQMHVQMPPPQQQQHQRNVTSNNNKV